MTKWWEAEEESTLLGTRKAKVDVFHSRGGEEATLLLLLLLFFGTGTGGARGSSERRGATENFPGIRLSTVLNVKSQTCVVVNNQTVTLPL